MKQYLNKIKKWLGFGKQSAGFLLNGHNLHAFNHALRLGRRKDVPPGYSENSVINLDGHITNRRIRDLVRNAATYKRAVELLRDLVVGTGINAYADPFDASFGWNMNARSVSDLHAAFDYCLASDQLFEDWASDPEQFDIEGNKSFYDIQRLACSEMVAVGDALIFPTMRKGPRKRGEILPLRYKIYEWEMIDTTQDRPKSRAKNAVVNGFEIDKDGREVGVWLYDEHPDDHWGSHSQYGPVKSTFYSRKEYGYHHLFVHNRPTQHSGRTHLAAMGDTGINRDKFMESETFMALKSAMHLLVAKVKNPEKTNLGLNDDLMEDGDSAREDYQLGHSYMAYMMDTEEDIELLEPTHPNNKIAEFMRHCDLDLAKAINVAYASITGNFSGSTYEATRAALNLEDAQIRPITNHVAGAVILPIRRRFNDMAVAMRVLSSVRPAQYLQEYNRYSRYDVIAPTRVISNPEKEIDALISHLRSGLKTFKLACMEKGLHWLRVLRQHKLEGYLIESLDLDRVDWSKGNGGNMALQKEKAESAANESSKDSSNAS